ncbi:LysR family transcriptional regulator [Exiguobacterium sp. s133]|uniref:LysR family transcriptional regulator n=1 Tax=Exiguobacterium sp. s133 TaxID=2751213 RepID=UPI001BE7BFB7|nr:LysR family transcriptional regulator [Exiguobacterium sp. s133]
MRLHELRTFISLVETKHFTKTAEQLYISQPTVSLHLKRLETHFGQALIHRHSFNKTIEISEAGQLVYRHAKEILHQVERLDQEMDELEGLVRGHLKIAATHTIYETMLEKMIHRFVNLYPEVVIDAKLMNQEQVEQAVLHYEIDLGLVEGVVEAPQIEVTPFTFDRLRVIGRRELDLSEATFIYREEGSAGRAALESWLATNDIVPQRIITVHSNRLVKQLIENGTGISMISERLAGEMLDSANYRFHNEDPVHKRTFQFVTLKGQPTRLSEKWMAMVVEEFKQN